MTSTVQPVAGLNDIVEFAGLSDDGRRRHEMLNLARRLGGAFDECAAFLWLYDDEKEVLHLDHYEPMELAGQPRKLERVAIPCTREQSTDERRIREITRESLVIRDWLQLRRLSIVAGHAVATRPPRHQRNIYRERTDKCPGNQKFSAMRGTKVGSE